MHCSSSWPHTKQETISQSDLHFEGAYGVEAAAHTYFGKGRIGAYAKSSACAMSQAYRRDSNHQSMSNMERYGNARLPVLDQDGEARYITSSEAAKAKKRKNFISSSRRKDGCRRKAYFDRIRVTQRMIDKYGADAVHKKA